MGGGSGKPGDGAVDQDISTPCGRFTANVTAVVRMTSRMERLVLRGVISVMHRSASAFGVANDDNVVVTCDVVGDREDVLSAARFRSTTLLVFLQSDGCGTAPKSGASSVLSARTVPCCSAASLSRK